MNKLLSIYRILNDFHIALAMIFAALCSLSCAKAERVYDGGGGEIVFEPQGMVMSKATSYPEDVMFGVFAYHSECDGGTAWDDASALPVSTPYFENAAFKKNGEYWTGFDPETSLSKAYYWPLSGSLMFVGYSPFSASGSPVTSVSFNKNVGSDINPYILIGFTQKTDPSQMVDLMWFDIKDIGEGKTLDKSSSAINVVFKHALSKVTFNFHDSHCLYRISDVSLKGCVNSATFYSGKVAGWMPQIDQLADYLIPVPMVDDAYPLLDGWTSPGLFIIPQSLDGVFSVVGTGSMDTGVDVVLSFTINDGFGSQTVDVPLYDHTDRWHIGYHYNYNVTINADPIHFGTPSVTITSQAVAL